MPWSRWIREPPRSWCRIAQGAAARRALDGESHHLDATPWPAPEHQHSAGTSSGTSTYTNPGAGRMQGHLIGKSAGTQVFVIPVRSRQGLTAVPSIVHLHSQ